MEFIYRASNSTISSNRSNNIYEDCLGKETVLDLSSKGLENIPTLNNSALTAFYLKDNNIKSIPDDFFPSLTNLKWLDLRENELTTLPATIKEHPCLTHLLLQNNKIETLPNVLGTLPYLVVLQLGGNPITYPPKEIISAGTKSILTFLGDKFYNENIEDDASTSSDSIGLDTNYEADCSFNSVMDAKIKSKLVESQLQDSNIIDADEQFSTRARYKNKCSKFKNYAITNKVLSNSSNYLNRAPNKYEQNERIRRNYLKDKAQMRYRDKLVEREKILQGRKNVEVLRGWRKTYMYRQMANLKYFHEPQFPYGTDPEYMALLNREDIERELPDKYRKRLIRRVIPAVPRKTKEGVHLAMQIKQLFETLDTIDLNKDNMTPRTEQKKLLNEIQKITEIKRSLQELSTVNSRSVVGDVAAVAPPTAAEEKVEPENNKE